MPGYLPERDFHILSEDEVLLLDYKAGDYIYILSHKPNLANITVGDVLQIESVQHSYIDTIRDPLKGGVWSISPKHFRKATPEEIVQSLPKPTFKVGDYAFVHSSTWRTDFRKDKSPIFKIEEISDGEWLRPIKGHATGVDIRACRLATPDEIASVSWYPHLTPCLVRESESEGWKLRYASSKVGQFYINSQQEGLTTHFPYHQKLDINNLPVSK